MDTRIQHIIEKWYLTEGALFQIFGTHNLETNTNISCPFRCGRGVIEYNPSLITELSDSHLELYLKAEVIRILLKHPYERQPDSCKRESMSIGSDLVLSDNYDFAQIGLAKPQDYNLEAKQSYEWYSYKIESLSMGETTGENSSIDSSNDEGGEVANGGDADNNNNDSTGENDGDESKLSDDVEIQLPDGITLKLPSKSGGQSTNPCKVSSDNSDSQNNPVSENKADLSALWEEDSLMACNIDTEIDKIEASHSWGSLAGNISEMIVANTKAKIDYRKVLAGFRASVLSSKRHLTRMRPNRRSGFENMGSIRRFTTKLLVAVDVSESIRSDDLSHFYSVIIRAFKYGVEQIDVVQFDTKLSEPQSIENAKKQLKKVMVTGRGGTDFQPIFDYAQQHSEYDGLIIFTDGYAGHPRKSKMMKCGVLWVCNNYNNYQKHNSWMRTTGRACSIKI